VKLLLIPAWRKSRWFSCNALIVQAYPNTKATTEKVRERKRCSRTFASHVNSSKKAIKSFPFAQSSTSPALVTPPTKLSPEAVSLFLEECDRMGTLKEVLEEAGYRLIVPKKRKPLIQKWVPPKSLGVRRLEVSFA